MTNDFLNLFIRNFNRLNPQERWEHHQAHPEVSFSAYKKEKLAGIAREVQPLKKVYLDTKFWIEIRDAIMGTGNVKPIVKDIFIGLKELVAARKIICPFSTVLFDELLKQGDLSKRKKTAQIADILTGSYTLSPLYYLIGCETYNFISAASGRSSYQTNYIWTKALSVLGDLSFTVKGENYNEAAALLKQKAYLDFFYQQTFQEVTAFNDGYQQDQELAVWHAGMLNDYKAAHTMNLSFEALHRKELFSTFSHAADGMKLSLNQVDLAAQIDRMSWEKIRSIAPFVYCYTAIYSALGRDTARVTKPNDYYDISHATLAVGSCDYYFAEKSFTKLLTGLKLDQKFNISIASDHVEILELIKQIN